MKAIRMSSDKNVVCFENLERIDEAEIFNEAISKLKNAGCELGEIEELPYLDVIKGKLDVAAFDLVLDLNYGTELRCTDEQTMEKLIRILNN